MTLSREGEAVALRKNKKRVSGVYANAGGQGIRPRDVQSRTIAEEACCDSLTHTLSHTLPLLQPPCFLHSLSMEDRAFQAYNYSNKSPSAHATH